MTIHARLGDAIMAADRVDKAKNYLRFALACCAWPEDPAGYVAKRWPKLENDSRVLARATAINRSAVSPGTTSGADTSALAIADAYGGALVEYLRPRTVIGRMQGWRRAPFNVKIPRETSSAAIAWVGQGQVRPLSAGTLDTLTLPFHKASGVVPITEELAKFSDPAAEDAILSHLARAIVAFQDTQALDASVSATGANPASFLSGATSVTSGGLSTVAGAASDIVNLLAALGSELVSPYIVTTPMTAVRLASKGPPFDRVSATGIGDIFGVPTLTSNAVLADSDSPSNAQIVAVDADRWLLAEGPIELGTSTMASVQMETAPDSPATASTIMVSLWQQGLVGLRVQKYMTWAAANSGGAAVLTGLQL